MAELARYIAVSVESITGTPGFPTKDEAVSAAAQKARSSGKAHAVVHVLKQMSIDPVPALLVTSYDDDPPAAVEEQP